MGFFSKIKKVAKKVFSKKTGKKVLSTAGDVLDVGGSVVAEVADVAGEVAGAAAGLLPEGKAKAALTAVAVGSEVVKEAGKSAHIVGKDIKAKKKVKDIAADVISGVERVQKKGKSAKKKMKK